MQMVKKIFSSEEFRIKQNGDAFYYSYGEVQHIEDYTLVLWDDEKKCVDIYDKTKAPETEYLIRTDLRKSCGVVRVGENEPAFLDKLILIWKQPWGHIRGFFLNGDARNKKKMRLFEFTIYCNDPIPSELQQKFLELYCIGAFGSNSDVVGCFEKLLLQEKTDGEDA